MMWASKGECDRTTHPAGLVGRQVKGQQAAPLCR